MRVAVGIVGAAIGNLVAPGIGTQAGFFIGSLVGGALGQDDLPAIKGPKIDDGNVTSSTYGVMIPWVFGTLSINGNIVDAGPLITESERESHGGKGGPSQDSITYTQFIDYDVAIGRGVLGLLKIYVNETLIYDATPNADVERPEWLQFTFYEGSDSQQPDPTFEALRGVGNVPNYRGVAHVVFKRFKVSEFGTTALNFRFVVTSAGAESISSWTYAEPDSGSDTALHIVHNTYADLMIGSLSRPENGTYDTFAVAIDPYSHQVVWRAALADPVTFGEASWVASFSFPDVDELGIPLYQPDEFVAVFHENEEFVNPRRRWLRVLSASSGVELGAVRLTDSSSRPILLSAYRDQPVFYQPIAPASLGDTTLNRHTFGVDLNKATVSVDPPDGYKWSDAINGLWARRGSLFADTGAVIAGAVINTTTGAHGVVTWTDELVGLDATSIAPAFSSVGEIALADGVINAGLYDSVNDCFWVLSETASNRIVIHRVAMDATVESSTNWDTEFGITAQAGNSIALDEPTGYLWVSAGTAYAWPTWDLSQAPQAFGSGLETEPVAAHPYSGSLFIGDQSTPTYRQYRFGALTGSGVSLKSVVERICDEPGTRLLASDRDATALAAITVAGFRITRIASRAAALQELMRAFQWDFPSRSGVLTAVLRGGASVATLGDSDLGAHIRGTDPVPRLVAHPMGEDKLPKKVGVAFIDATQNYERGFESYQRQASSGGTDEYHELAVVLSHDEAARLAAVLTHGSHVESVAYEAQAMPSWRTTALPAAVVTPQVDGKSYPMRITSAPIIEGGIVQLRGVRHDASVYTGYTVGGTTRDRNRSVKSIGASQLWALDLPSLREADLGPGLYLGVSTYSPTWDGAVVQDSPDGVTYAPVATLTGQVTIGYLTTLLGPPPEGRDDPYSTVNVQLTNGSLASLSDDQLHTNGTDNFAAVGAPGRWEIARYSLAVQQADGTWNIAMRLRALRDTWEAAAQHAVGDKFIVLDATAMRRIVIPTDELNTRRYMKAVSIGRSADSATVNPVTPAGRSLRPFRPHSLHAYRSGNDWIIEGERQDRKQAAFLQQPELSEASEAYLFDVLDIAGNVVSTHTSATPNLTYTEALQNTDFGDVIDFIKLRMAQDSAVYGPGAYAYLSAGRFAGDYAGLVTAHPDLIEYWPQNETVGATMVSASASHNGLWFAPTSYNQPAITIDGAKSVKTTGTGRFDVSGWAGLATVKSIEYWLKPDALPSGDAALLLHTDGTNGWALYCTANGTVIFKLLAGGVPILTLTSSSRLVAGQPATIVPTFEHTAGGAAALSMNGARVATGTLSAPASLLSAGTLSGGSVYWAGTSANLDRWHNKLALYDEVLSPADIYAHALAGLGT